MMLKGVLTFQSLISTTGFSHCILFHVLSVDLTSFPDFTANHNIFARRVHGIGNPIALDGWEGAYKFMPCLIVSVNLKIHKAGIV